MKIETKDIIEAYAAAELACLVLARHNAGSKNKLWVKANELREELRHNLSEQQIMQAQDRSFKMRQAETRE